MQVFIKSSILFIWLILTLTLYICIQMDGDEEEEEEILEGSAADDSKEHLKESKDENEEHINKKIKHEHI